MMLARQFGSGWRANFWGLFWNWISVDNLDQASLKLVILQMFHLFTYAFI